MKKQLIIAALAVAVSYSTFAQGYVNVAATGSPIKQTFVNGTSASASGNVDFAILWGVSGTPLIGSTASPTASSSTSSAANWTALLNDPNYQLAYNATTSALITGTTSTGLGAGNFSAGDVPFLNSTAGANLTLIVIGWAASAGATPQAAAAANGAVGWSAPITYASGANSIATVLNLTQSGLTAFGVNPLPTPEPGTMALAALGGASLLLFRRKK